LSVSRPPQCERRIWKRAGRLGWWRTGREEEGGSGSKRDKKRVRPGTWENWERREEGSSLNFAIFFCSF
ncbi:hypothetical protein XENORESO_010150, partial [Xenotaenia resolanae]